MTPNNWHYIASDWSVEKQKFTKWQLVSVAIITVQDLNNTYPVKTNIK